MTEPMILEAFMPDFSGFSSPDWAALLSGPRERAAASYEKLHEGDNRPLDRDDYLKIIDEVGGRARQCAEIAKSFCDIFGIHLALKLGIPHGLRFSRYDAESDRIVALVPLFTVRNTLDRCEEKRHRSLDGIVPTEFEPLWQLAPESGGLSEAASRCLARLDRAALSTVLRAFANPGVEEKAIAGIAAGRAELAFSNSIDWEKFRAVAAQRRREKYPRGRSLN